MYEQSIHGQDGGNSIAAVLFSIRMAFSSSGTINSKKSRHNLFLKIDFISMTITDETEKHTIDSLSKFHGLHLLIIQ